MSVQRWTPTSRAPILVDPSYCLSQPATVTDEEWIEANAKAIDEMGAHTWINTFLMTLRSRPVK